MKIPYSRAPRGWVGGLVILFLLSTGGLVHATVTFSWATVDDPGNADDQDYGSGTFGGVSDNYKISKYEVTNAQYVEFLNAVADTDTFGLYNLNMGSNPRGGISRSGSSGSYVYATKPNMDNKPVNYVSFFDAMRFVNWLENGQGSGGTESGVYTIDTGLNETRDPNASFWLPSEDEWYKAAYYQPTTQGGPSDCYWLYPTGGDSAPTMATATATGDISNPGVNVANHLYGADWNSQDGNVTTVGSAGPWSASYYGTFDQGGNVWEWNEAVISGTQRGLRGGAWDGAEFYQRASHRNDLGPVNELDIVGFRVAGLADEPPVAGVPEPSVVGLLAVGSALAFWRRR